VQAGVFLSIRLRDAAARAAGVPTLKQPRIPADAILLTGKQVFWSLMSSELDLETCSCRTKASRVATGDTSWRFLQNPSRIPNLETSTVVDLRRCNAVQVISSTCCRLDCRLERCVLNVVRIGGLVIALNEALP